MKVLVFFWQVVMTAVVCIFGFLPLLILAIIILALDTKIVPLWALNWLNSLAKLLAKITKIQVTFLFSRVPKNLN